MVHGAQINPAPEYFSCRLHWQPKQSLLFLLGVPSQPMQTGSMYLCRSNTQQVCIPAISVKSTDRIKLKARHKQTVTEAKEQRSLLYSSFSNLKGRWAEQQGSSIWGTFRGGKPIPTANVEQLRNIASKPSRNQTRKRIITAFLCPLRIFSIHSYFSTPILALRKSHTGFCPHSPYTHPTQMTSKMARKSRHVPLAA